MIRMEAGRSASHNRSPEMAAGDDVMSELAVTTGAERELALFQIQPNAPFSGGKRI